MTKLERTDKSNGIVRRETTHAIKGRPIMVELRPVDTIVFRLKGTRREYHIAVITAFEAAVRVEAERERKLKAEQKKARKAGHLVLQPQRDPGQAHLDKEVPADPAQVDGAVRL